MKVCQCAEPQFALANGCFLGGIPPDAEKIKPFIGKYVCFFCGGIAPEVPHQSDCVTGGTILLRLKQLGVVV